jgi:hypothetical protein
MSKRSRSVVAAGPMSAQEMEKDETIHKLQLELQAALAKVDKYPVVHATGPDEFVRHVYWHEADTGRVEFASENVEKGFLGATARKKAIFGKLLVSSKEAGPTWNHVIENTTPGGYGGVNHKTKWTQLEKKNRAEFRFWGNWTEYEVVVKVDMCTAEKVFLRTLIDMDGSASATMADKKSFQAYFTPTAEELEKNNNNTTFQFKTDVVMHTKL